MIIKKEKLLTVNCILIECLNDSLLHGTNTCVTVHS